MTPLEKVLEIYKKALGGEVEMDVEDTMDIDVLPIDFSNIKPKEIREISKESELSEGDIIEIFPSIDGLELYLLVYRIYINGCVELLPVSKFYELATPDDVLVYIDGNPFIVETDLGFEIPLENFPRRFGNRKVFKIGRLTPEELKEIEDVYEGRKKGAGGMYGGPKEEFKALESKRYFVLFANTIIEEEELAKLSLFFEKHKEHALVAGEEEKTWGEKGGIKWFYDRESEKLILIPVEELKGKRKRISLKIEGDEIVIFEGELPERINIPLSKGSYSYSVLMKALRVEDV